MAQQARASAQPPLPQEAYSYADRYHLGQPQTAYRVVYGLSIFVGTFSLFVAALFVFAVNVDKTASGATIAFCLLWTVLLIVAAVYYLIGYPLRFHSWRIYGCVDGFVFLKGDQAIPFHWDEIAYVWQRIPRSYRDGVYARAPFECTVQRSDGVQVAITRIFRSGGQLSARVRHEAAGRLLSQALAAVKEGQTLPFGPFSLSQQGLTTPKGLIPWSKVQQVRTQFNWVTIERRGQRPDKSAGRVDQVPNLQVFLTVADKLARGL